jgi:sugar (pentulose or hexulose) kinase
MDYEYTGINDINSDYELIRPDFRDTLSPNLPAGLNLGKQLYWQKQNCTEYSASTDLLMYPQYWAWRFSGVVSSEVTSLGCHTDLWSPLENDFSKLVNQLDLAGKIPEIVCAWEPLGKITTDFANLTGLSRDCLVYPGVHDSNASLLRYNIIQKEKPFTVISTGTWTVMLNNGGCVKQLDNKKDMLANTNIFSQAIPCARFMGGREFEAICKKLGGAFGDTVDNTQVQVLLDKKVMAMPDFSDGSGPFGGLNSQFIGTEKMTSTSSFGVELATLYCALMIDYQLDQLSSDADLYIEGAFLKNPILCGLIAQLRQPQSVYLSNDITGTVTACAYLTAWPVSDVKLDIHRCQSSSFTNLDEYKGLWLSTILEKREYEKHS